MKQLMNAVLGNGKTTTVGLVALVAAVILFFGDRVGINKDVKDAAVIALIGILGGGAMLSRDADKDGTYRRDVEGAEKSRRPMPDPTPAPPPKDA